MYRDRGRAISAPLKRSKTRSIVTPKLHDLYLNLASQSARHGMQVGHGGPFGAVIVRKGKVLASAHNQVLKTNNPTRHAEINAITTACRELGRWSLHDCEIYSTNEPCPMCFSAIHWARLRRLVYSTSIKDVKRLGFNELRIPCQKLKRWGKSKVKIEQVGNRACIQLLKDWRQFPFRKVY